MNDHDHLDPTDTVIVRELRRRVVELERANHDVMRQVADLKRQNKELRGAVAALLAPTPSEVSENLTPSA